MAGSYTPAVAGRRTDAHPAAVDDQVDKLLAMPRELLLSRLAPFLRGIIEDPDVAEEVAATVYRTAEAMDSAAWAAAAKDFSRRGSEFEAYPAEPSARALTFAFLDGLVDFSSTIEGVEHFDAAVARVDAGDRVLIVGNHTSYADTTSALLLLRRSGRTQAANRVAVLAGPKVFEDAFRRFASAAVPSIKVAQSARLAHNEAGLSPREVAIIARRSLETAAGLMDEGLLVLLYAEGTRARDRRLQPFLRATGRYATLERTAVLPLSQAGADGVMPVGEDTFRRAPVTLRFGPIIEPGTQRVEALEAIHRAVEAGLPAEYRPPSNGPRVV